MVEVTEPQEGAMSRHHTPAADRPIAAVDLFAGLSRRQLRQVGALSTLLHRPAGGVLVREGQPAQELIVILSGHALATVDGEPVAELAGGAHVGTSVPVERARHRATVTTVTPTDILVFSVADIRDLIRQNPVVRARLEATEVPQPMATPRRSMSDWTPSVEGLIDA
jgi:CRP-like cAMP-binding protein